MGLHHFQHYVAHSLYALVLSVPPSFFISISKWRRWWEALTY